MLRRLPRQYSKYLYYNDDDERRRPREHLRCGRPAVTLPASRFGRHSQRLSISELDLRVVPDYERNDPVLRACLHTLLRRECSRNRRRSILQLRTDIPVRLSNLQQHLHVENSIRRTGLDGIRAGYHIF